MSEKRDLELSVGYLTKHVDDLREEARRLQTQNDDLIASAQRRRLDATLALLRSHGVVTATITSEWCGTGPITVTFDKSALSPDVPMPAPREPHPNPLFATDTEG